MAELGGLNFGQVDASTRRLFVASSALEVLIDDMLRRGSSIRSMPITPIENDALSSICTWFGTHPVAWDTLNSFFFKEDVCPVSQGYFLPASLALLIVACDMYSAAADDDDKDDGARRLRGAHDRMLHSWDAARTVASDVATSMGKWMKHETVAKLMRDNKLRAKIIPKFLDAAEGENTPQNHRSMVKDMRSIAMLTIIDVLSIKRVDGMYVTHDQHVGKIKAILNDFATHQGPMLTGDTSSSSTPTPKQTRARSGSDDDESSCTSNDSSSSSEEETAVISVLTRKIMDLERTLKLTVTEVGAMKHKLACATSMAAGADQVSEDCMKKSTTMASKLAALENKLLAVTNNRNRTNAAAEQLLAETKGEVERRMAKMGKDLEQRVAAMGKGFERQAAQQAAQASAELLQTYEHRADALLAAMQTELGAVHAQVDARLDAAETRLDAFGGELQKMDAKAAEQVADVRAGVHAIAVKVCGQMFDGMRSEIMSQIMSQTMSQMMSLHTCIVNHVNWMLGTSADGDADASSSSPPPPPPQQRPQRKARNQHKGG
jgi:hypothetical protein